MSKGPTELYLRPVRNPNLKRPTREDPILGKIEYRNYDGGCWQGGKLIGADWVRLDVEAASNIKPEELANAAEFLIWIERHRAEILEFVKQRLLSRQIDNLEPEQTPNVSQQDIAGLPLLRPYLIDLWDDRAEIRYDCDLFPSGDCAGFGRIDIEIRRSPKGFCPADIRLLSRDTSTMAAYILERPVPPEISGYVDSLADQFVATAGTQGWFHFDRGLHAKLAEARRLTEMAMANTKDDARRYLRSVQLLLNLIAKEASK